MSYFIIKTRAKTRTENGKEFLYNKKVNKLPNILDFFSKRLITNDELKAAEAGLYTWILRESGNIYASKTLTKQEIGTLHVNLDMLTKEKYKDFSNIIAAGEFEIIKEDEMMPNMIIFNLLSGSYMVKKFDKLNNSDKLLLRNDIVKIVQNKLSSLGIPSQFLECSVLTCSKEELIGGMKLIENANIRTPAKNLSNLNLMFNRKGGKRTFKNLQKRYKKTRKMRV